MVIYKIFKTKLDIKQHIYELSITSPDQPAVYPWPIRGHQFTLWVSLVYTMSMTHASKNIYTYVDIIYNTYVKTSPPYLTLQDTQLHANACQQPCCTSL